MSAQDNSSRESVNFERQKMEGTSSGPRHYFGWRRHMSTVLSKTGAKRFVHRSEALTLKNIGSTIFQLPQTSKQEALLARMEERQHNLLMQTLPPLPLSEDPPNLPADENMDLSRSNFASALRDITQWSTTPVARAVETAIPVASSSSLSSQVDVPAQLDALTTQINSIRTQVSKNIQTITDMEKACGSAFAEIEKTVGRDPYQLMSQIRYELSARNQPLHIQVRTVL
jgi:hypothetical protein